MLTATTLSRVAIRPAMLCKAASYRRSSLRAARLVVRSQQEPIVEESEVAATEPAVPAVAAATPVPGTAAVAAAEPFSLLGATQEAINGRAAMLGFLIAVGSELATNQSVWSQIAGKYVDRDLVEAPIGASILFYAFTVVAITFASFAPLVLGKGKEERSFGPFTPKAETWNGRAAQVGFAALLLVELLRGNTALF